MSDADGINKHLVELSPENHFDDGEMTSPRPCVDDVFVLIG